MEGVKHFMRVDPWNPNNKYSWSEVENVWNDSWDKSKPILLEKSPPNLLRAFEIEQHFSPSYFIVMMRDPYANCEGICRRHKDQKLSYTEAAESWVMRAQYQIKNIQGLENVISLTYEDMAEDAANVRNKILNFMPELQDLDFDSPVKAKSIVGGEKNKIVNYNSIKTNSLSTKDLNEINSVLENYPDVMEFFGYNYLYPNMQHSSKNKISKARLLLSKITRKISRKFVR